MFQIETGVEAAISGLTIANGSAASGGGVYNQGTTQLTDCTVSGNFASGNGGGLFNSGTIILTDCTVSGNSAVADGGGLASSGTVETYSCTLSGNSAVVGGGIANLNAATATLEDTIVAGNTRAGVLPSDIGGNNAMHVVGTYDLVGTGGSGGISNGSGNDIVLSGLTGLGLAPLGNYGGLTETIALLPGSPAIGAGIQENGVEADQRGEPLDSPNPDIGAFQSQGFTLTPVTGSTPQTTTTGSNFAESLSITITPNNPEEPVAGGIVNFTLTPASDGASATLSSTTAVIGTNGTAHVDATANATAGTYSVTASAAGARSRDFTLTNLYSPTFSNVNSQSVPYGTAIVTVTGTLADGSEIPVGLTVVITLGTDEQYPTVGAAGNFMAPLDASSLTAAGSPYTITYSFAGWSTFTPAMTTSTLTVTPLVPTVSVADSGGTYNNDPFPAMASVAGIGGSGSSSLEGVGLTVVYYSGTFTNASQLTGLTPLAGRRARPVRTRYWPASRAAPTTQPPRSWPISPSPRRYRR